MYEQKSQPLLPRGLFFLRLVKHIILSSALIFISLGIGVVGYHQLEGFSWIDSLLNASMILGGMGPVNQLFTDGGKIFASVYALFSGVVFLAGASIIIAPIAHRIMHHLHIQESDET